MFYLKISSTYGRKQKAGAMAACRRGNIEKFPVSGRESKSQRYWDANWNKYCTIITCKLCVRGLFDRSETPWRFSRWNCATLWTCLSVNCPSEPEKLHCVDITQINEAIEATKLQPLSQDSMKQQTVSKEACKLSLKAALSQEFHSHIKNAHDRKPH